MRGLPFELLADREEDEKLMMGVKNRPARWLTRNGSPIVCLLLLQGSSGCQILRRGGDEQLAEPTVEKPEPTYMALSGAHITHVNSQDGFVILECAILPSSGEEAKVYRDGKAVGLLRILDMRRGSFVVADILVGKMEMGDEVTFRCIVSSNLKEALP